MKNEQTENKKRKEKVIILYDSKFGNTKKVAISLSRGLEAGGFFVDYNSISEFNIERLNTYNIIGLGGPTHICGMSKPMKRFIFQIKELKMKGKSAFVFETRYDEILAGSSGKKIMKRFSKLKMDIIYPLITGIVTEREGPLVHGTLSLMERYGLEIAEILYNKKKLKEVECLE